MSQIELVFVFLSLLPFGVVIYGIKTWYRPVQWGKNMRGGYHSRRADKTPEHWLFAQMEYARVNLRLGSLWSLAGILQLVLWKLQVLGDSVGAGIAIAEVVVYYIAARTTMEKKLSKRFDQSDALLGR